MLFTTRSSASGSMIGGCHLRVFNSRRAFALGLLIVLGDLVCGCNPRNPFDIMPSDSNLRERFFQNQPAFAKWVQMSNEDQHVIDIQTNSTFLDTDVNWPRENIGFSKERWNEYRRMFHTLDIDSGLTRRTDYPPTVFINAYGSGGVLGGSAKGYVYSEKPLSPLVDSLDVMPRELYRKNGGHAIVFRPLAPNWYMYREEY
jgi:hypothetical protein